MEQTNSHNAIASEEQGVRKAPATDTRTQRRSAKRWYVVQVARGKEQAMAELLSRVVSPSVLDECFFPQYVTEMKQHGVWQSTVKPLFPGYLVAVTADAEALEDALTHIPEFARVLTMGDGFMPLMPAEQDLIARFTERGHRVVPMSYGVKEGDRVVVTEGPLLGHEGMISDINRHKSTAYLRICLCGRQVGIRVGLGVLNAAASPEARMAAALAQTANE